MSWTLIIVLILIGIMLLLLELLVIPGATVAGIAGFGLIVFSIYMAYDGMGVVAGHWTLAGTLIVSLISIILAFRSRTWKKAGLDYSITGKAYTLEPDSVVKGDTGTATSRLTPSGKARIKGQYYEVQCQSGMVDAKRKVIVTKVEGNKIYVKPINTN
ncbi:MAG: NfeD family protein [Bacteroidales bacterium]